MTLLGLTGSNVCKTISNMYRDMEKKELLEKRNRSILAHGTIAVSSKEYAEFVQNTKEIVSRVVGNRKDFKELLDQATHPQLTLEL